MVDFIYRALRWLFTIHTKERKEDREDFDVITRHWEGLFKTIQRELAECKAEHKRAQERIEELERRVEDLEVELKA